MSCWRCVCSYDGTDFSGWQSQPTRDAVQDVIEARLDKVFKRPVRIHGSGRTDAGVHALGQVFHFVETWDHSPENLRKALNVGIPPTIRIKRLSRAKDDFHARYSATGKRYIYQVKQGEATPFENRFVSAIPYAVDWAAVEAAGQHLVGTHDFSAFAALTGSETGKENPVKDFREFDLRVRGKNVRLTFEGSGFMYKMVRSLVGTLLRVGQGKISSEDFREILESGVRNKHVITAPAQGLFLEKVFYER